MIAFEKKIRKKKMAKKAIGKKGMFLFFQMIFAFYRIFVLTLIIISLVLITKLYINVSIDTQQAEMELFQYQLLSAKQGISHYEPSINRVYPMVIDYTALKNKNQLEMQLQNSFHFQDKPLVAAQIDVSIDQNALDYESFESVYYYHDYFDQLSVLARSKIKGAGGAKMLEKEIPVFVRKVITINGLNQEKLIPATMKLVIVSSNS